MSSIYLQGFNFGSFAQKGVDPHTGQYTCAIAVYESPSETRNCPPLHLSLSYNPLSPQNVGLGQGWSFNLSGYRVESNSAVLSLSTGEHYQITETSRNVFVDDQKLRHFKFDKLVTTKDGKTKTLYQVTHKSGLIEILSDFNGTCDTAVPIDIYNATGHSLKLVWSTSYSQPRLSKVQEGGCTLLEINYRDDISQVDIVRNPKKAGERTFSLTLINDKLGELKLPAGEGSWTFTYEEFRQGFSGLSTVNSPAGLQEEIHYQRDGHSLPNGAPYNTIPYVIWHTVRPGNQQPAIETSYSYSDQNFLGYNGCDNWDDGKDNLYRVPDDYEYSTTVLVQGGHETSYTYNKFHLVVKTEQQKGTKRVTCTTEYHALPNTGFEDQPAQYQLPKTVKKTYQDTATKASRTETSYHVFDEWGNPTQEIDANGIKTERVHYPAAGETDPETAEVLCPADPNGFQRYMKEETVTPAVSAHTTPTRSKRYTYSQLPTATGSCPSSALVLVKRMQVYEGVECISTTDLAFVNQPSMRDHGRTQQTVTRLNGQYPQTRNWTYQYPSADKLVERVENKTFDGLTVTEESVYCLLTGLVLGTKDPAGNDSRLNYDKMDRVISATVNGGTSYEATRRYEFSHGESGYKVTVTSAKGVKTRYTLDELERVCQIESQDDDGQFKSQKDSITAYNGSFRPVQQRRYNSLNQCVQVDEIDWLKGSEDGTVAPIEQRSIRYFGYDDWGHVSEITRSSGLVTVLFTDPISLTHTEGIKGQGKTETRLNLFGSPAQRRLLNKYGDQSSVDKYSYDGLGRLVSHTDNSGHEKRFKYDAHDRIAQTISSDGRVTDVGYAAHSTAATSNSISINQQDAFARQDFDGIDRLLKKEVGCRATSYQPYQDSSPQPTAITMPRGDTLHFTYDKALNHALTSLSDSEGSDIYHYDYRDGATTKFSGLYSTETLQYAPSGLESSTTIKLGTNDKTLSTQSIYSMVGKLQFYKDVHGQIHETQYDRHGRPKQLAQGKVRVSFDYDDKIERLSASCAKDEENHISLKTCLKYDDFGREVERVVIQDDNKTLYRLSQTYDGMSLIATRDFHDHDDSLLLHEEFRYDSLGRLIDYQCLGSSASIPVDNKGHKLKRQEFRFNSYDSIVEVATVFLDGSGNTASYTYSDRDPSQLVKVTNTHSDYPATVELEYDANGYLTRDEQGRNLEYDSKGHLTTIKDTNKQLLAHYRYDSTGKLSCQSVPGQPDTHLFYRGDSLIATSKGERHVSYVSDGKTYWGETILRKADGDTEKETRTSRMFATDFHQSVLTNKLRRLPLYRIQWERRDPVTGWYHLGNGYRVYNPVLMRFHTPDSWSPFVTGEVNAYGYWSGDPINLIDPSGHLSIFGHEITTRDLLIGGVGIGVGILVGMLTAGAGLAIMVGASIAAGALSDAATGAVYDWASGQSPTWESVGTDALYGAIGGLIGEVGGRAVAGIGRGIARGVKASARSLGKVMGRSGFFSIPTSALRCPMLTRSLSAERLGPRNRDGLPVFFNSVLGRRGNLGFMTHGGRDGYLLGSNGMRRASQVAREDILPAINRLQAREPGLRIEPVFTLMACHSYNSGAALDVSRELGGQVVGCFENTLRCVAPSEPILGIVPSKRLFRWVELPGEMRDTFPGQIYREVRWSEEGDILWI
ncbi:hypothetical protein BDW75DRAFT_243047 [Aspergillus navahoensis]